MLAWHLPTDKQVCEPPQPRGINAQPPTGRKQAANKEICHSTQEFSLVLQEKVYFLRGRVRWIFLISLLSALGSKQHILFHSLQCFINNMIASLCFSHKYLDTGSCL